eukprot:2565600-Rhodomonas_salina.1
MLWYRRTRMSIAGAMVGIADWYRRTRMARADAGRGCRCGTNRAAGTDGNSGARLTETVAQG